MEKKSHEVSLSTIGSGAAVELFGEELRKVLSNIADVNTAAEAKREISLRILIKPSKDRSYGAVQVICTSRLAPVKPYETSMHMGLEGGEVKAFEEDAHQFELIKIPGRTEAGGGES